MVEHKSPKEKNQPRNHAPESALWQALEELCAEERARDGKTPEARHRKILAQAKRQAQFSMQDVVAWLPNIPRRTLERDIAALVKKRALKAKGELKARTYTLAKWQR